MNEVCNGFQLRSFDATIGPRPRVSALIEKVSHLSSGTGAQISINESDLKILENALRESLLELGTEEFSTKTGLELGFG